MHDITNTVARALIHGAIYRELWALTRHLGPWGTLAVSAAAFGLGAVLLKRPRRR